MGVKITCKMVSPLTLKHYEQIQMPIVLSQSTINIINFNTDTKQTIYERCFSCDRSKHTTKVPLKKNWVVLIDFLPSYNHISNYSLHVEFKLVKFD